MKIPEGIREETPNGRHMWLGMLIGGGLGWVAVQHTADGSLARFFVDERTAWLYVAALAGVLAVGAAAGARLVAGAGGALAVALGVAAMLTLRPSAAASSHLGAPLAVAAAVALAAALLSGLQPAGDQRHPVRRLSSRRARRAAH